MMSASCVDYSCMPQEKASNPALIYVGPTDAPAIQEAVRSAGAWPVDSFAGAEAAIWTGGDISELTASLHGGISWLQLPSAGIEKYVAAGLVNGRHVTTSAGPAYAGMVAEHALALMLSCARRLHSLSRQRSWSDPEIGRLYGSTVAIVGCGRIGKALMSLLEPFDVDVFASTRTGRTVEGAIDTVTPDRHAEIIALADFVVVAAPATPDTERTIGRAEFRVMRPQSFLINISRGSLVDTDALVDAVQTRSISGAAIDVTDPEPLPAGHPLWQLDEVLITPHCANPDVWNAILLPPLVQENVARYLKKKPLLGRVQPKRGY